MVACHFGMLLLRFTTVVKLIVVIACQMRNKCESLMSFSLLVSLISDKKQSTNGKIQRLVYNVL